MSSLEDRVRKEIGEEVNVFYVEALLKKTDMEILQWLHEQCDMLKSPIQESMRYVDVESRRSTLELGTRIFAANLKTMLFIVHELQARTRAISEATLG